MAKDIWKSLLITHLGNSQVKDNKIDLLVQQYEQFTILEEKSIDSGFARFNTIITSLKALDEGFSYIELMLEKVSLVHESSMEKDSEIYRGKKERVKFIALKAKKESSDDETSTSGSDDEEYAMAVCLRTCLEPDEWIKDSGCSKHMTSNKSYSLPTKHTTEILSIEVDDVVNIKESKNHPLDQVIGNLNQRTLRSQAQDHSDLFCFISTIKPKNVNEALKDESWVVAMQEELNKFIANDIWDFVPLPMSQSVIGTKWVFKNKLNENGIVSKNKARLVAQGYNQQEGIDYDETYAPVARLESIRILLAIACANDFKLYQMDVKSAFLNSFINEDIYVAQRSGFIDFQKPNYVYKLKKALYGLKQAPKAWYDRLNALLIKHEYSMGMVDNTLFTKKSKSRLMIVQIYVDDIIFGSTSQNLCDDFAKIMYDEFEMSMMGELNFFLGLQIKHMEDEIFFNQSKYIKEMLKKFGLKDSKPTKTPMSTEIKLTKDDEADSLDSFKYQVETVVYADSNHAGDYVDRKSTSGVCRFMECCLTSWFAKKQTALAISTTEAEYVSARKACQQALWMKQTLIDYDIRLDYVLFMCDNKGAIDLSKNLIQHSRTKHIEIRHHFLRDNVQKGNISIEKVASEDNIADIFTKPLKCELFNYLRLGLGMMELIMDSDPTSSQNNHK
ncbi:retrovirus-related pol polyprotein from transposon TNT 1-94 [Tanacetum coccineum]